MDSNGFFDNFKLTYLDKKDDLNWLGKVFSGLRPQIDVLGNNIIQKVI
jgi:hypothetical protein